MPQKPEHGDEHAAHPAESAAGGSSRAPTLPQSPRTPGLDPLEPPRRLPPSAPTAVGADIRAPMTANALVHLYRAEVGRLTAYRARLDTTTSWAITTSALFATFTYGSPQNPAAAFLFLMVCDYFFLYLEARRFVSYEASRYRVYWLERFFYGEVLGVESDSRWVAQLVDALRNPSPTISVFGALGWRLRRNYIWIFVLVLCAWIGKLHVSGPPTWDAMELIARAGLGDVPDWLVVAGVGAFYVFLLVITAAAHRIYPRGDEDSRHMEESLAVQ
jgi:uncharacterized membrane protein